MAPLPGSVHTAEADRLYDELGQEIMAAARRAVEARGVCHLALSGGSTPEPLYTRLVTDPRFRELPWEHVHLWLVDERQVDPTDEASNWRMIRETLADHVPLRSRQIHPLDMTEADPARTYEQAMRDQVACETGEAAEEHPSQVPRLDFVLLGMGGDGHTASLFPHSPALREHDRLVTANEGGHVIPPPRVTMTYPLLNGARQVAVLVTGAEKHDVLQRVEQTLKTGPNPPDLPITGISPLAGELTWFLDDEAAGQAIP